MENMDRNMKVKIVKNFLDYNELTVYNTLYTNYYFCEYKLIRLSLLK